MALGPQISVAGHRVVQAIRIMPYIYIADGIGVEPVHAVGFSSGIAIAIRFSKIFIFGLDIIFFWIMRALSTIHFFFFQEAPNFRMHQPLFHLCFYRRKEDISCQYPWEID